MKYLLLWVTVILSSESLFISWTPHADNRWLSVVYNCGPKFQAVNIFEINAEISKVRVHLVETPAGPCTVGVDVVRATAEALFDEGIVAESISFTLK